MSLYQQQNNASQFQGSDKSMMSASQAMSIQNNSSQLKTPESKLPALNQKNIQRIGNFQSSFNDKLHRKQTRAPREDDDVNLSDEYSQEEEYSSEYDDEESEDEQDCNDEELPQQVQPHSDFCDEQDAQMLEQIPLSFDIKKLIAQLYDYDSTKSINPKIDDKLYKLILRDEDEVKKSSDFKIIANYFFGHLSKIYCHILKKSMEELMSYFKACAFMLKQSPNIGLIKEVVQEKFSRVQAVFRIDIKREWTKSFFNYALSNTIIDIDGICQPQDKQVVSRHYGLEFQLSSETQYAGRFWNIYKNQRSKYASYKNDYNFPDVNVYQHLCFETGEITIYMGLYKEQIVDAVDDMTKVYQEYLWERHGLRERDLILGDFKAFVMIYRDIEDVKKDFLMNNNDLSLMRNDDELETNLEMN